MKPIWNLTSLMAIKSPSPLMLQRPLGKSQIRLRGRQETDSGTRGLGFKLEQKVLLR